MTTAIAIDMAIATVKTATMATDIVMVMVRAMAIDMAQYIWGQGFGQDITMVQARWRLFSAD